MWGNRCRCVLQNYSDSAHMRTLKTISGQAIPWLCASNLITCLNNPYLGHHDMFNIDALISGAERESFLYLRASFN